VSKAANRDFLIGVFARFEKAEGISRPLTAVQNRQEFFPKAVRLLFMTWFRT
jgi:hypothetical protein